MSENAEAKIEQAMARAATIGFDATSTVGERTGIGYAAARLLDSIAERLPERWRVKAWINSARKEPSAADAWRSARNVAETRTRWPGRLMLGAWRALGAPKAEHILGEMDVYHSPASYLTPTRRARRVLTVHDLFFLDEPEDADPLGGGYFAKTFPTGLGACERIIAVSEFTKSEVARRYGIAPERIAVVHHGVDRENFNERRGASDERIARELGGGGEYLLCVSTIGPKRKNAAGLLEAHARARRELGGAAPALAVVGRAEGAAGEAFDRQAEELGLAGGVRRVGYLAMEDLPAAYRGAAGLIVPSLSEGFGMTALEAMACGCPVLAARTGALPEVCGEAALMFAAGDGEAMARAIAEIARDAAMRERLREAGRNRAREFSWDAAAEKTIRVYAEAMGGVQDSSHR